MKDKLIGLAFGLLLPLIMLFIQANTPLFKSKVRISLDEPLEYSFLKVKTIDDYHKVVLIEVKYLVNNSGFKSGALEKVSLVPHDLRETPKVEIIDFYRGEIPRLKNKWCTFKAKVYLDYNGREAPWFAFEFYDEYEDYAGKIMIEFESLSTVKKKGLPYTISPLSP